MSQQNNFQASNRDSEQSLSDDENDDGVEFERVTYDNSCAEKLQSLLSRERRGKDGDALSEFAFTFEEPRCPNNHHHNFESEKCTWSAISKEANELMFAHEKTRSPSFSNKYVIRRSQKDGKSKGKHKFSMHFPFQNKKHLSALNVSENEERGLYASSEGTQGDIDQRITNCFTAELLGVLEHEDVKKVATQSFTKSIVPHARVERSVSMLLEDLQEMDDGLKHSSDMLFRKRKSCNKKVELETTGRRISTLLGDRLLDNSQNFEHQDNGISSDDEDQDADQNQLSCVPGEIKEKAMMDLFQEAFNSVPMESELSPVKQAGLVYNSNLMCMFCSFVVYPRLHFPRPHSMPSQLSTLTLFRMGYYGRLQHVMQAEKESHVEFLKQLQMGPIPLDDSRCIEVQILSRLLDAKLTVCRCQIGGKVEILECGKASNKCNNADSLDKTIIFQSKICDSVELEVGNMIRIYPPWKEVQLSKDEGIILCTYFSHAVTSQCARVENV